MSWWKVLLWGKKGRWKNRGKIERERKNKRGMEGVGERAGSGKLRFEVRAPFIFPVGNCNRKVPRMVKERCRQVWGVGHRLWFLGVTALTASA